MELKERYIEMRNKGEYNLQFFYDFYLDQGGKVTDPKDFTEYFLYSLQEIQMPMNSEPMYVKSGNIDREQVLNHMDRVFNLTILEDKDRNFIRVVG